MYLLYSLSFVADQFYPPYQIKTCPQNRKKASNCPLN